MVTFCQTFCIRTEVLCWTLHMDGSAAPRLMKNPGTGQVKAHVVHVGKLNKARSCGRAFVKLNTCCMASVVAAAQHNAPSPVPSAGSGQRQISHSSHHPVPHSTAITVRTVCKCESVSTGVCTVAEAIEMSMVTTPLSQCTCVCITLNCSHHSACCAAAMRPFTYMNKSLMPYNQARVSNGRETSIRRSQTHYVDQILWYV